jgi:hypothetical protein
LYSIHFNSYPENDCLSLSIKNPSEPIEEANLEENETFIGNFEGFNILRKKSFANAQKSIRCVNVDYN